MLRTRPILGFAARFLVVFGLAILPWLGGARLHARAFRWGGQAVFNTVLWRGHFIFRENPEGPPLDTRVFVANRARYQAQPKGPFDYFSFSSRNLAYLPTVLLVALVLASPVAWRRRLPALAWGLGWLHLFHYLSVGILVLMKLGVNPALGILPVPPWLDRAALALDELFLAYPGSRLAVAVLIWILVVFRREDWRGLLGAPAQRRGREPGTRAGAS